MYAQLDGRGVNRDGPFEFGQKYMLALFGQRCSHARLHEAERVFPLRENVGAKSGQVEWSRRLFLFAELCGRGVGDSRQRREEIFPVSPPDCYKRCARSRLSSSHDSQREKYDVSLQNDFKERVE